MSRLTLVPLWVLFNTATFLAGAFVSWDINPGNWTENARLLWAVVAVFSMWPLLEPQMSGRE